MALSTVLTVGLTAVLTAGVALTVTSLNPGTGLGRPAALAVTEFAAVVTCVIASPRQRRGASDEVPKSRRPVSTIV
jgi:hypothetical protein